jgi:5-methylcytosine-specific restriction enzyme subunit McrC
MIEIPLTEGPGWSPAHRLTPGQAAVALATEDIKHRSLGPGEWQFRAHQQFPKVGAIRLGAGEDAVLFRVAPKIPIARLMFLVQYAEQNASARWDEAEVSAREEEGLVAAVARAFGRAALRALRSGVLTGYREADDELTVIRGRIRAGDQARKGPTLGLPLAVTYDDFTPDIPENRLLLAAARELGQLPELRDDVLDMLGNVERRLSGIGGMRPDETWMPTRLNAHYYRALNLAGLVLRGNSYELDGDSGVRADGLLISMPQLFQDFLAMALGSALHRYGGDCLRRQEHHLDDEGMIRAQTDAEYYAPGDPERPAAIIDAKYTVLGAKGRSGRVQQIISYCYKLGASHGYLVYAQGPEPDPVSHTVGGIVITEYPLNLDQPPPELLKQIGALAAAIAG